MAYDPAPRVDVLALEDACALYTAWVDATYDSRTAAIKARDYYDGKQWTAAEVATLKGRKQAAIVINRIKPKVDYLLGAERQGRTDPKAYPRNPTDEGGADAATDALRYATDKAKFQETRSDVFENILIEGCGGSIVEVEQVRDRFEIVIRRIAQDRLWWDPHSSRRDFKDARYLGVVTWMDQSEVLALYPGKADFIDYCVFYADTETHEDKPKVWNDPKRKRVKLVEIYYNAGTLADPKWMRGVFTRGAWLEELQPCAYVDEDGHSVCPMELTSAYVDRENNRYGVVQGYIGPQDEINHRRSKALHLLSVRQTFGNRAAIDDLHKARTELAKPDGHVEVNGGSEFGKDFGVLPTGDMAMGQLELLQEAKAEIDAVGANAALQGKQEGGQSGRAIQARQQGGQIELGPLFDALHQWSTRIYEQVWMRVKQYWTAPMWIRVTDDEQKLKYVGLNQQTTAGQQILEKAKAQGLPPQQMQMLIQQVNADPRSQLPAVNNDLSQMDVDIVIDSSPDVVTLAGEQFALISELYKANPKNPANPEGIPFELVIKASSLRDKDKLLDMMKGGPKDPQQMAAQEEQMAFQKQMAGIEMQLKSSEAAYKQAQAEKARAEAMKTLREANTTPQQTPDTTLQEAVIKGNAQVQIARDAATISAQAELEKTQIQQAGETQREAMKLAAQPKEQKPKRQKKAQQ